MKYLVMLLGSQADYDAMNGSASAAGGPWTAEDLRAMVRYMDALNDDLATSGELVDGQGLAEPAQTRAVTADEDGRPVVSDSPYGETRTKEVLAGYWLVDCPSFDRAAEIAARAYRCPVPEGTPVYPVLVRPVMDEPPG